MDHESCQRGDKLLYGCRLCSKVCRGISALKNHMTWMHEKNRSQNKLICHQCKDGKAFSTRFCLNRHTKRYHTGKKADNDFGAVVRCPLCDYKSRKPSMESHFLDSHSITVECEDIKFKSDAEFDDWKEQMEAETRSKFVAAAGWKIGNGVRKKVLVCHRSGNFRSKGNSERLRKMKACGTNKINAYCPAKIELCCTETGFISVNYQKTHIGHSMDLTRLPLTKADKELIAQKISSKVSFDEILNDVREPSSENNQLKRLNLLTRKDLHNIVQSYNLNNSTSNRENNISNMESWISFMKTMSNVIRFYKAKGEVREDCPQLKEEDFLLIIANDTQLEILKTYGDDCICVDGSRNLNSFDFEIYCLLVVDELSHGFPAAILFTNRCDTLSLQIFFEVVKNSLGGPLEPNYFMSDLTEAYYIAWSAVMPTRNTKRIYSSWHVDKAWKVKLNKINGKDKQLETYKKVKALMIERNILTFNLRLNELMTNMHQDSDTKQFAMYFEKFKQSATCWAHCHRLNSGIPSNMHLENMLRTLKLCYLQGRKKRLDKAVYTVMKFIRDKFFDRILSINSENMTDETLLAMEIRHKLGMELVSKLTLKKENAVWKVPSSNQLEEYNISEVRRDCDCNMKCVECSECIHSYVCTCYDAAIRWSMCKHIHLVCQMEKVLIQAEDSSEENVEVQTICCEPVLNETSEDGEIVLKITSDSEEICTTFEQRKQDFAEQLNLLFNQITNDNQLQAAKNFIAPLDAKIKTLENCTIIKDEGIFEQDHTYPLGSSDEMSSDGHVEVEIIIQDWES